MKPTPALAIAFVALLATGCMNDRTRSMTQTCQSLLGDDDRSNDRRFIREAEQQLASLDKPGNRMTKAIRDLQDKDAMAYKSALRECLWMLKSRQS